MQRETYDVVILGGGNAGFGVTGPARDAGLKVAMVEARELGGTCPNRGCVPKKVLVAAAHALHEIGQAHVHCIKVDKPRLDWNRLINRKKNLIAGIPERLSDTLEKRGVTLIRGDARFVAPNGIEAGDHKLEAKHIVIATGSKPRDLPIPGTNLMITSDQVLSEQKRPDSVVFVGGGVIALEFAHVFARAGSKVTILEVAPQLLSGFDEDAVKEVLKESERIGIKVHCGVNVKRLEKVGKKLRTIFEADGIESEIDSDRVVNGTGRKANVDTLNLEAGNVAHNGVKVLVDDYLRSTSNSSVYVCGDVTSSPQLSPVATYEGRLVGQNIVDGAKHQPNYAGMPSCVYTVPALASVGLTEAKAKQTGLNINVHVNDMEGWLAAKTFAETVAWSKIIVEDPTDRIVGAHIVGHAGEELINIFGLAMAHGITASQIKDFVFAYPTFSADVRHML